MAVGVLSEPKGTGLSPLLVATVLTVSLICLFYVWEQSRRLAKLGNMMPGPTTIPFFGNALMVLGKTNAQVAQLGFDLADSFANVVRLWFGFNLIVFLTHPEDVEIILNSNVHIDKSDEYKFFKPWLGEGLLISSGDRWRSHRKLIAPAFHINVLKSFIEVFNKNSLAVVEKLKNEVGKVFDIHDYMSELTVNILLETAMGGKPTSENGEGYDYAMAVMKMCDIIHQRHYKIAYRFDMFFKMTGLKSAQEKLLSVIHGLTNKVIKQKNLLYKKNLEEGNIQPSLKDIIANDLYDATSMATNVQREPYNLRDDLDEIDKNDVGEKRRLAFLDLMIETKYNGESIDDHDIKEEVDTIMFEGHDTTAAGSSFVLCLLGIHQDVQDRVFQEQKQIFGKSKRPTTFADTLSMKYLERVILETLRLYPPVPIIARKIKEDVQLKSGNYILPAGCTVVITTYIIHHRPEFYPNPNAFNPDNFLPEQTANRHYYSYIPFSAGPRSCVGRKYAMLKLKIVLSTIIRHYRMKSSLTEKDFKLQGDIILKRADGFRLEIETRN